MCAKHNTFYISKFDFTVRINDLSMTEIFGMSCGFCTKVQFIFRLPLVQGGSNKR